MLCNATLMVQLSNFKPNFSPIFCSSFKLFEHQTVRLSRVHCIFVMNSIKKTVSKADFHFQQHQVYDAGVLKMLM